MVSIATGDILRGGLPRSKLETFRAWFFPRQERIAYIWQEIEAGRPIGDVLR